MVRRIYTAEEGYSVRNLRDRMGYLEVPECENPSQK